MSSLSSSLTVDMTDAFSNDCVPPEHEFRTLVLCFDGTGDQFDGDNSNVVAFCETLKKSDHEKQLVYYQPGIGTYTVPGIVTPITSAAYMFVDEMFAWNLDTHVKHGYEFLMQSYRPGDKICIFGFSRGAYTARTLAGMLNIVGLLPPNNFEQIPFAYKMYVREDDQSRIQSQAFKKAFCNDVEIEFLGVWDTVSSVGLVTHHLPFTSSNNIVKTFRHALALDEHRAKFKADLYQLSRPTKDGSQPITTLTNTDSCEKKETDILEVWFAGCHCDVGGGSVSNSAVNALSRISLRWMIRECFKTGSGIMFDMEGLKHIGLDAGLLHPKVRRRPKAAYVPIGSKIGLRQPKESSSGATQTWGGWIASFFRSSNQCNSAETAPLLVANGIAPDATEEEEEVPTELVPTLKGTFVSRPVQPEGELPPGREEEEELADCLSPAYDQLELRWFWRVMEWVPMHFTYQLRNRNESWFGINYGSARAIPLDEQKENGFFVHRSVKMRMQALESEGSRKGQRYQQKLQFHVEPTWVD